MPAGGVLGVPAPEVCCDLGRIVPYHPQPPRTPNYTDPLGFNYYFCPRHARVWVAFWQRLAQERGSARHQSRPWMKSGILPVRTR